MEDHLGSELKRAREKSGLSLREISTRTKISIASLEALEREDFSRLPGGIFGRSFIKAYAVEVGLEPDVIVARFLAVLEHNAREAAARRAVHPEVTPDDRRFLERQRRAILILQIVIGVIVLALLALVLWQVRVRWGGGREASGEGVAISAAIGQRFFVPLSGRLPAPGLREAAPHSDRICDRPSI